MFDTNFTYAANDPFTITNYGQHYVQTLVAPNIVKHCLVYNLSHTVCDILILVGSYFLSNYMYGHQLYSF